MTDHRENNVVRSVSEPEDVEDNGLCRWNDPSETAQDGSEPRVRGDVCGASFKTLGCETDVNLRYEVYGSWQGVQKISSSTGSKQGTWTSPQGSGLSSIFTEGATIDIIWADGEKDTITTRDGKQHLASSPGKVFKVVSVGSAPQLE